MERDEVGMILKWGNRIWNDFGMEWIDVAMILEWNGMKWDDFEMEWHLFTG